MRIIIPSVNKRIKSGATSSLTQTGGFTKESKASLLLDSNRSAAAVTTAESSAEKTIYVGFAGGNSPEVLIIELTDDSVIPKSFTVIFYDDRSGTTVTVNPESAQRKIEVPVAEFFGKCRRLSITFNCGGVKISELDFSYQREDIVLSSDEIVYAKINESVDMGVRGVKTRSLIFEAENGGGKLSVLSGCDFTGGTVSAEISVNGEYVNVGSFYIDSVNVKNCGSSAVVRAFDITSKMRKSITGLYSGGPVTVGNIISLGLGATAGLEFITDDYTSQFTVCPSMLNEVDTQEKCILYLAQAAGAAQVWADRSQKVHMEQLAGKSGCDGEIPASGIIEYCGMAIGKFIDYIEVAGECSAGEIAGKDGWYYQGCVMERLKNDFVAPLYADTVAARLRSARNCRFKVILKTRCDPAVEIGDRIRLYDKDSNEIGVFTVTKQLISFSKDGLSAVIEFCSYPMQPKI